MGLLENAQNPHLTLAEQAADVATPGTGLWRFYTKADGLYLIDDAGTVLGPLGTGGGGGGGLTLIDSVDLSASQATIDFTSIPNTYRNLRVVLRGRTDRAGQATSRIALQLGTGGILDTGTNYRYYAESWQPQPTEVRQQSNADTHIWAGRYWIPGATATAGRFGSLTFEVFAYASTTIEKVVQGQGGSIPNATAADINIGFFEGAWNNTAAVDTIRLYEAASNANFVAGTRAELWGLG